MAMITIGGVALPNPTSYKVSLQDLDSESTTRSETGKLTRDRVRAGVYKIDITWQVKKPQLKQITDQLKLAKVTVTFFDPTENADHTAFMYSGDRTGSLVSYLSEDSRDDSLWELSLQLTEY